MSIAPLTLKRPVHDAARQPDVTGLKTVSQDTGLVTGWRGLAESSSDALLDAHPQLVLADRHEGLLLNTFHEYGELANLAVLLEKTVKLPMLPGLPWRVRMHGLRLVGSRLLGSDAETAIPAFTTRFEQLLSGRDARCACLLLEDLPADSPWWQAFEQSSRTRAVTLVAPQTRWFLRVPDSPDAYWSQFSSKTRYNLRRQKRMFDHQWEAVSDASQVEAFVANASAVSANSWQGKRLGLRVSREDSFLRQFRNLANLQALRCYLLRSQDEPVAFAIGTQWNGRFMLEEIGYDTRYASSSPGTVLLLNMLEDMFQRDTPELVDFGFGDGAYKQLFGNESSQSGTLLVVNRRVWPTLTVGLNRIGKRLERVARGGLRAGGLAEWIRRTYRH